MEDYPDFCIIDPFKNIYPLLDRLQIQEILLRLQEPNTEGRPKLRAPHYLKVLLYEIHLCRSLTLVLLYCTLLTSPIFRHSCFRALLKSIYVSCILLSLPMINFVLPIEFAGYFVTQVENFYGSELQKQLVEANLSFPLIVKPQVACGVADAHNMVACCLCICIPVIQYQLNVRLCMIVQPYPFVNIPMKMVRRTHCAT